MKMGKKFRALGHLLENKYEELSLAAEWLAWLPSDRGHEFKPGKTFFFIRSCRIKIASVQLEKGKIVAKR